jgi:glutamate dehydrogenase
MPGESKLDEEKERILGAAAAAFHGEVSPPLAAALGGLDAFLRAYYRHIATEDLTGIDPARLTAVAMAHAAFGGTRPQGRPLVQVRPASLSGPGAVPGAVPGAEPVYTRGGEQGLDPGLEGGRMVIDIVTDDMPFLVDSVTMALNRHDLRVDRIVHPQLRVRRDLAGQLLEVRGPAGRPRDPGRERDPGRDAGPGEINESWIHVDAVHSPTPASETSGVLSGLPVPIEKHLSRVLDDVRVAVEDQRRMASVATTIASWIAAQAGGRPDGRPGPEAAAPVPEPELAEGEELLRWLADDHFTFLGYREYNLVDGPDGMALQAVPGTGLGILRHDRQGSASFAALPAEARAKARERQLLVLTKANSRSTVHRPHYLDYVAVKRFGPDGEVVGEHRFLGLYSHVAYSESVARIPVLRRKLAEVLERSGLTPDSHDGQDLTEILETYPREELFQISVDELLPIALGVLRLRERKQTRLFLRRDPYGRYMSCLVYFPRDRYTTQARLRTQEILRRALGGKSVDYSVMVGESALARLQVVVRGERGRPLPEVDADELERAIAAAVRTWDEDFASEAEAQLGPRLAVPLAEACAGAAPDAYKADVAPAAAVADLARVCELASSGQEFAVHLYTPEGAGPGEQLLTVYRTSPIVLSDILPQLQHMGVEVVDERPYEFTTRAATAGGPVPRRFWIYEFGLRSGPSVPAEPGPAEAGSAQAGSAQAGPGQPGSAALFEDTLAALWRGEVDDDGFNALVLAAGLSGRQVVVLRAYAKYLRQAGGAFGQEYLQRVLRSNPRIARLLLRLFESRFDPGRSGSPRAASGSAGGADGSAGSAGGGESETSEALAEEISGLLDEVASLDHDRVLRSYLALIRATLRTNYYQAGHDGAAGPKPYLVFKLDPHGVPDLPAPRPQFEVFVYSPRFEGVHLRFGRVARGGLRWSDREEDYRTEILGLVKAQQVKNSVIVPAGAKGGFVCKRLPDPSRRDAWLAEGTECYKLLVSGLLDVTDNLVRGRVVPPPDVVRHDGDDPYLVVAADKGTATFSDIANEIAASQRFWLGDAFASGGSAGYDHKKMGITARGAWESVKYHMRSLGVDVQAQECTVAGIGDMSGDVFGNGMLLSDRLKLVAAFDHRNIFVDPDPDPAVSHAERARLFALPRSSWADYDAGKISAGGGVWPRTAKSVPVSPQARAVLGMPEQARAVTPNELIKAILAAPVDLLWNGGIGTYVKASTETDAGAGDRSNDAVRIDASALRARVVGEGGNLGVTQAARIEYALAGGLINTDFIDNSAGVDTSDHEVNIKILLDGAVRDGELTTADRDKLLHEMTGEVAELVLRHNYQQNVCLAAARKQARDMLHVHARYMRRLERDGRLPRKLEFLPGDKEIAERRSAGLGLTAPEFAVLLAQTKIALAEQIAASELPDAAYLRRVLAGYFPHPLRQRYAGRMAGHPLRREIITTAVVNEMVDRSGTTFAFRLNEETGASAPEMARAWLVAREVFGMPEFWASVEALDGQVETVTQIRLLLEGRKLTERAVRWLLHNRRPSYDIGETIDHFADGALTIASSLPKLLGGRDLAGFEERRASYTRQGVPPELAERTAGMVPAYSTFDIVETAATTGHGAEEAAEVYFDLAERLQITTLRERIIALPRDDRWNTMARSALRDDLYAAHAALTRDVLVVSGAGTPEERLATWLRRNAAAAARARQTLSEIWESDRFTVATLSVALRAIRTLVEASALPPDPEPGSR